jgi:amino acid adenylation domain-containing protein
MKAMDQKTNFPVNAVAVVGMSGRFPGASNIEAFWTNLVNGVESISRFSPQELEYSQAARDPENASSYVPARALLEDADLFDAAFFGLYPKQAEVMDPQHRLFLECAWEALESAGYDPEAYPGLIGLYGGISFNTYIFHNLSASSGFAERMAVSYPVGSYDTLFGNDKDFMTTRVGYKLNLRGPVLTVQSACSTSLVAVAHAYFSLLTYQCDMALAGGVSVTFPQKRDYLYTPDGMVSSDGTCRSFDAQASGTVFGSGLGIVVLKRLADAIAEGDHIHAVILGAAMNNDGSARIGYAAPGVDGQSAVIALAQDTAGVDAETISYVEAHGTGTPLGDPIEVAALTQAFRRSTEKNGFCALGTAKTNVGHLDIAAGVTGFIKTVLQLERGLIPPLLHFQKPNPRIDFAHSPFYPVEKLTEWKRQSTARRAGVSAFGVGGTNAHVILEEAPVREPTSSSRSRQLLLLSAKTETALQRMTDHLAAHLEAQPDIPLADAAFTLQKGRRPFPFRRAVIARDARDAVDKLKSLESKSVFSAKTAPGEPSVVFLFPGQGAQYVDMGRELYESEKVYRDEVDRCAEILRPHLDVDIRTVLYPDPRDREQADQRIKETWITQPAIFVTEYALARLWMAWGMKPAMLIGHSIGEYVAAVLAGTFELEDALALLSVRARLMQSLPAGSMLAVRMPAPEIEPRLPAGLSLAAVNSPATCTVSGPTDTLQAFQKELEALKIASKFLPTSHAFHSPMMDPILQEFTGAAQKTRRQDPRIPWISTCTGRAMTADDIADAGYWARQLRRPVRFSEALETAINDGKHIFLEIGPGRALSQLARQQPSLSAETIVLATLGPLSEPGEELTSILASFGRLWLAGWKPDWEGFYAAESRRRVPLPTYPFERKRFWHEPAKPVDNGTAPAPISAGDPSPLAQETETAAVKDDAPIPISEETPMPDPKKSDPNGRRPRVAAQIRTLINELSGIEIHNDSDSFMELGLDSLFLTQASQAFQSKFGVKISFRQLLDDLSTVSALAEYLDKELPPGAYADAPAAAPAPTAAAPAAATPAPAAAPSFAAPAVGGGALEQLLVAQAQLLQALIGQQQGRVAPAPPAPVAPPAAPTPTDTLPVIKWPSSTPPLSAAMDAQREFKRFGPYKPIVKGEKGGLTPRQQKALDDLIARYLRKSPGSKRYTAENRPHFADPRAVAGFKSNWKEMVYPIVSARSKGSKIWDLDGNEYVDITMGFGAYFFGHSPDWLIRALEEQIKTGLEIGPQSPLAGKIAKMITEFTGLDRVTFCNTGSEAVMAAIRLSRTVSGRKRIVYFTGDYHGMFEEVLVRGVWPKGEYRAMPIAPGIPSSLVENILVLDYGSPEALDIIKSNADDIAAVIVEPVQSRQPGFQPREFMHELRAVTERAGAALVFDEVVTGFRCHPGGAQGYFGVKADLATYGKVIGGGMPIGVLAGKRKYMDALDGGMWNYGDDSFPEVGVTFFAGTFVRHPLAMAAAWAVMNYLKSQGPRLQLSMTERVAGLCRTLNDHFAKIEVPIRLQNFSAFAMIEHAQDLKYASLLWYYLRLHGLHVWEERPCFFTLAHTDEDFDRVVRAFKDSVAEMQDGGFLPESPAGTDRRGLPAPGQPEWPRFDKSPMTEAQREIFFSVQMGDEANCSYNESNTIHFDGPLQVPALEKALLQLVERHPALRSTFTADGEGQLFYPAPARLDLPLKDFSALPLGEAEEELKKLCVAEQGLPFNLVTGPLLRFQLITLTPTRHALIMTAHHLVCDGWSFGMIIAEMSAIYNALTADKVPMLPPPMPFGDYARLLAKQKDSPAAKASEEYWVSQFSDEIPALELPTDRPRPALKDFAGAMESRVLNAERFARLKKATPRLGGTMFSTLLGAFAAFLHRLTGQEDLVIGVPAAGQTMVGCNELIGHCLNFLPMRLKFHGDQSFLDFAKAVKTSVLDAYEHQDLTYGTLIQKLKLPRDTSRLPLVSVMFNIDKTGLDLLTFEGLQFHATTNAKRFVNFDLFFNLIQTETSLEMECEYNTSLFDRSTILRWLEAFENLIEGAVSAGEKPLNQLPWLGEDERRKVLLDWNDTLRDDPGDKTLPAVFAEQVRRNPQAVAVECGPAAMTYGELDRASGALASRLQSLGVAPGALVGLYVERSVEMLVGLLGILKSGAAYVPMDPAFPAERLAFMVEDSEMAAILTQSKLVPQLPPHRATVVLIEDRPSAEGPAFKAPAGRGDDLAYVIFTSGSSGRPKGVKISHRAVINFLNSMRREPGLKPDDVLLAVTTLSFDIAGLELWLPLTTGAKVVIAPSEALIDGNLLRRELEVRKATVMQATPSTWRLLLEAGWTGSPKLKILVGGEAVPRELVNTLSTRCGSLWNMYGPTETTIWSAVARLQAGEGPVSIGRPIDNTQIYIVNAALQPQPIGVPGELLIGGTGVGQGYLKRDDLTREKFIADPFSRRDGARLYRTGDLALWRPDGTLEYLGRLDSQVKLRGFRIELGEIEVTLAKHPGVGQCAVVVRDDGAGDKRLIAYFVPASSPAPAARDFRIFLSTSLPEYMIPSYYLALAKLPLTPNGKLDRRALPAPRGADAAAEHAAPAMNARELLLAQIWKDVLHRQEIRGDDDIFDLGGDSIQIFQIAARAGQAGLPIKPADIFRSRTIARLAAELESRPAAEAQPTAAGPAIKKIDRQAFRRNG